MIMIYLIVTLSVFLSIWFAIWFVTQKWFRFRKIYFKFGGFGLRSIRNISLKCVDPAISVEINIIKVTSCFVNREVNHPISIVVSDVKIEIDASDTPSTCLGQNKALKATNLGSLFKGISLLKLFCLTVRELRAVVRGKSYLSDCIIHTSVDCFTLDFSSSTNGPGISASIDGFTSKLMVNKAENSEVPCIVKCTLSAASRLNINVEQRAFQDVELVVSHPSLEISEGFFAILRSILLTRLKPGNPYHATETQPENTDRDDNTSRLTRLLSSKKISFVLHEASICVIRTSHVRPISIMLKHAEFLINSCTRSLSLQLLDWNAFCDRTKMLSLQLLHVDAKIIGTGLLVNITLNFPYLNYLRYDFHYWLSRFCECTEVLNSGTAPTLRDNSSRNETPGYITSQVSVKVLALQLDSSAADDAEFISGFEDATFQLLHDASDANVKLNAELHKVFCSAKACAALPPRLTPSEHAWNNLIYLDSLNVKLSKMDDDSDSEGSITLNSVQAEWSIEHAERLMETLLSLRECRAMLSRGRASITSACRDGHFLWNSQLTLTLSSLNVFLRTRQEVYLMVRLDELRSSLENMKLKIVLSDINLIYQNISSLTVALCPSADLAASAASVMRVSLCVDLPSKDVELRLNESITLDWTPEFFLCLWTCLTEGLVIRNRLREQMVGANVVETSSTHGKSKLTIVACVKIVAHLSDIHQIAIVCPALNCVAENGDCRLQSSNPSISFDGMGVIHCDSLNVHLTASIPDVSTERLTFTQLKDQKNRCIQIISTGLTIAFPDKFDFAACFEQFLTVIKWIKLVTATAKRKATPVSLPPDVIINVDILRLIVHDDPFEVKLADNYALLIDEYAESVKRKEAMDAKVEELRRQSRIVQGSKLEELYNSLQRKNADIFIQRSRQLYSANSVNQRPLVTFALNDIKIIALADSSLCGKANEIRNMQEIDQSSPLPGTLEFITLWCRMTSVNVGLFEVSLRDYPIPLLHISEWRVRGRLIAAEQEGAARAKRDCVVRLAAPWHPAIVYRNMPALKFYHDLTMDVCAVHIAFGACWENTFAQVNQAFDFISKPSEDPSLPLPFWDKLRLLLHGRLVASVKEMRWLYHVSLDPYNSTELFDWSWGNMLIEWTEGQWILGGNLDIYAKTASKYDDCLLLHLPSVRVQVNLDWVCLGNPRDHHSVMPCAADKVPDFSLEDHDSYRGFRSRGLNVGLQIESITCKEVPSCLFYSSTLRFLDVWISCLSCTTRPTRRGPIFKNTVSGKSTLGRHIKDLSISFSLPCFSVTYWTSHSMANGFQLFGKRLALNECMEQSFYSPADNLIHRMKAVWSVKQFKFELCESEVHLCSSSLGTANDNQPAKTLLVQISKLTYHRVSEQPSEECQPATHQLRIYDLKLQWTAHNRDICFGIFEGYQKANNLKRNLSSNALKSFQKEKMHSGKQKSRSRSSSQLGMSSLSNSMNHDQSGRVISLLQQLLTDGESNFVVHSEDSDATDKGVQLQGIVWCQKDDIVSNNLQVELLHSQVRFHGCEHPGYIIVSAAKATLQQCHHQPIWRKSELMSKTSWVSSVDGMQYFATLSSTPTTSVWLSNEYLEDRSSVDQGPVAVMLGSSPTVGGIINERDPYSCSIVELQRVISRCKCQLFYASYGDVDLQSVTHIPPMPEPDGDMMNKEEGVDTFTLLHHDVCVTSNPSQYTLILDIVNKLVLYIEPRKRELSARMQDMKFALQLSNERSHQREPILSLQNELRELLSSAKHLEKELYLARKMSAEKGATQLAELDTLSQRLESCKSEIAVKNQDLAIMVSCYNQLQLQGTASVQRDMVREGKVIESRRNEVCFMHASWRLTEADGQVGLADLVLRNFVYTQTSFSDDSSSHQLELGWIKARNLIPNSVYTDVLQTLERRGSSRRLALRVFCKDRAPVGGIAIKEHFEVNLEPLTIQLTHQFYSAMMAFFFQQPSEQSRGGYSSQVSMSKRKGASRKLSVPKIKTNDKSESRRDIEIMKERAAQNQLFLYVKIPDIPLKVSYRGQKEKNIADINNFILHSPTLEYHNVTWTWKDLVEQLKSDIKKVFLAQAIKQKLQVKSKFYLPEDTDTLEEVEDEQKARMLLGDHLPQTKSKKGIFGKQKRP